MNSSIAEVFDAALALSDEDRGRLAEKLVESLDQAIDPATEDVWAAEIERRLARIDAGQARWLTLDEAVTRLHRAARVERAISSPR
ncbi:MAG: hypothetical protein E6J90_02960 [Deltaproteobacteria bacterium]|nr:MAG: hypothetical protein E6J91_08925 [Deltaproteobacteria bacterium]TMQ27216.1 MAG: hypothetical protein E6J90_02960 [Deltaproteobacteria bacterium]